MYIYFSFDTIFERLWLLSRVPLYRVTVTKETTEPVRTKFLVVKLESPFLKNTFADACTIVIIHYVERALVNCYNLCSIQLLQ
jgi:hypothetical protein